MKKNINKYLKFSIIFSFSLLLTSCNVSDFLNLKDEISQKLFPNVWAFLVQFLAFIIMCLIVFFFAYKPVKNYVQKRKDLLNNERNESLKNIEDSKVLKLESQKEIANSHKKASEIIESAKKEAEIRKEEIVESGEKIANSKITEANLEIERNKVEARKDIKKEIANAAIELSSKILEREITYEDNKKIIDEFIDKMDDEDSNE